MLDRFGPYELDAYFQRIGMTAAPDVGIGTLRRVQQAHRLSLPFENVDVLTGRGVDIDLAAVFAKLVLRRRGGYCFEHNALFLAALQAMGFSARVLMGRVWLNADGVVPPRNHALTLVSLPGGEWIADAGFGAGCAQPLRLQDGEEVVEDGARHWLRRDGAHGWMLMRDDAPQYSFTTDDIWPADLVQANHWTSTAAGSRFTRMLVVSRLTDSGQRTLRFAVAPPGTAADLIVAPDGLDAQLSETFGLSLALDELAALPPLMAA